MRRFSNHGQFHEVPIRKHGPINRRQGVNTNGLCHVPSRQAPSDATNHRRTLAARPPRIAIVRAQLSEDSIVKFPAPHFTHIKRRLLHDERNLYAVRARDGTPASRVFMRINRYPNG